MDSGFLTHVGTRCLRLEVVLVALAASKGERQTFSPAFVKRPSLKVPVALSSLNGLRARRQSLRGHTSALTLFAGLVAVIVSKTASVHELQTLLLLRVKVPARYVTRARSMDLGQLASICN